MNLLRVLLPFLVAAAVYGVSRWMGLRVVWPGTILAFVMAAITSLRSF